MKKFAVCCLIFCLLVCILPVSAQESVDASVTRGCNTLDGKVPYLGTERRIENGKGIVLYEATTDTLMYADNADVQLPPASLLKILTALLVLERGSLSDVVTVRKEVLDTLAPDAAMVGLVPDEVLTVKDLLYCMLVASGNDAAVVLADHVMNGQDKFVAEMNRYAKQLGCTNTNFTNAHGLHDPNQYTTARDIARILKKAIENEQFCTIFNAKSYTVPVTNKSDMRTLITQNYLLNKDSVKIYYDDRVTGSRTAVANDGTRGIASVAEAGNMKLICVVMGAESEYDPDGYSVRVYGGYDETRQLLDYGFNGNKTSQVFSENQPMLQRPVSGGSSEVSIGTRSAVYSVVPSTQAAGSLIYRYINEIDFVAPIREGQRVSTLQIWYGDICLAQTELYAMSTVLPAGEVFGTEEEPVTTKDNSRVIWIVVCVVLAVALLCVIIGSIVRANRIAKARQRSRRNSRNRRRSR